MAFPGKLEPAALQFGPEPDVLLGCVGIGVVEVGHLVVDDLERGDLPLEQSLAIFEEGVQLSRAGQRRLEEAEQRVERLLGDESGGVRTRPFDEDEKK